MRLTEKDVKEVKSNVNSAIYKVMVDYPGITVKPVFYDNYVYMYIGLPAGLYFIMSLAYDDLYFYSIDAGSSCIGESRIGQKIIDRVKEYWLGLLKVKD